MTSPLFIGREVELAALTDARRALAQSRGSLILIEGEPGIGKSRLIAQFLRGATEGRLRNIAYSECRERAQQPLGPIRTFAQTLAGTIGDDDFPPALAAALGQLSRLEPHSAVAQSPPHALEKVQLYSALVAFFKLVWDKRATIATIEDLHWADESTLDFLSVLVPTLSNSRMMIVATYRSDHLTSDATLAAAIGRLSREAATQRVMLEPLGSHDVRKLISSALGDVPLPQNAQREIEERCDGNPFFAEELLKTACANPSGPSEPGLPISIKAAIVGRLSNLGEDDRRVLGHAAVLGYRFDPAVLAIGMERSVDDVLPALRRARNMQIIVDETGTRALCRFRHALTRRTIYEDMLGFDARRAHKRILLALESIDDWARTSMNWRITLGKPRTLSARSATTNLPAKWRSSYARCPKRL